MIRSALIDGLGCVRHGLTTRDEGSIGPPESSAAMDARRRAVVALGGDPELLVSGHQIHGARVCTVTGADAGGAALPGTDGLVTVARSPTLMVQGADCPLVLLVDPAVPALAVVHSGWRGTVAGITARAVETLCRSGARAERVVAALFPGIGPCCFEVGPEVGEAFDTAFGPRAAAWQGPSASGQGRRLLDLHAAVTATLVDAGLAPAAIEAIAGCTACGGRLWSHRASGGRPERHGLFARFVG